MYSTHVILFPEHPVQHECAKHFTQWQVLLAEMCRGWTLVTISVLQFMEVELKETLGLLQPHDQCTSEPDFGQN